MAERFYGVVKADGGSISVAVLLRNISDGTAKTGVAYTDVTASYWRQGETVTTISTSALSGLTDPHAPGGWKQVDATKQPGVYRFDIPDGGFVNGVDWVFVSVVVASTFNWYALFALESGGVKEIYDEVTSATYGLDRLVRSTTPANSLDIDTDGNVYADLQKWIGIVPSALDTGLVQALATLSTQGKLDVNAEVDAALDEAIPELTTGAPVATPNIRTALALVNMCLRNKITNDGSWISFHNNTGTVIFKARISELAGLFTREQQVTGP